jgi:peptidoglycan/LPS O-acetylase OafA/YrhL
VLLIAPICCMLLTKSKKPAAVLLVLLIAAGFVGFACIGRKQMMGASRLPLFLIGMAFGMDWPVSEKKVAVRGAYIAAFAVGLTMLMLFTFKYTAFLNNFGMYWYPFALITPPLCVFIAWMLNKAEKSRTLFAPLRVVGRASFEIYLVNIWTVELAKLAGVDGVGLWIALCVGDLLLGIGYHMLITRVVQALKLKHAYAK